MPGRSLKLPPKEAVIDALRVAIRQRLSTMADAARETREGATHEENRAEGDKDMRSTEQSYLARGQAMRTEELADELQRLEAMVARPFAKDAVIAIGALVCVLVDEKKRVFFVAPHGGGTELTVDGVPVTVVTGASPVGAALLGKRAGDDFELMARGKLAEWVIDVVV